ncbi:MAG: N-6 DNA Methylase [candidate division CPR1 bacterium ADurb.Bin160]|uniref:site-specific DNA-methyltransferase (adenine-specific) n=1 Tax=candidate division CPR1 bacterium ADurb.Bin160 TaxID=1852826 RepID=A0A1V5ZMB3_9BACT|nr:MAG: N-6 DNA Methylase [candidate division CPR1 bacterium ADurb.Bin160]
MTNSIDIIINKINGQYYNNFIVKREKIFSEEDLRVAFSSLIDLICSDYKITIPEERHEYSVYKGRIDSLYGEVILEYKPPNYLSDSNNSPKNSKAIEQVQRHILGIEKKQKKTINRFLAVVFDGYKIIFVRRRNNLWDIEDPVSVDEKSFKTLLQRLFSIDIQGKALIIDNLVKDFSIISKDVTKDIKTFLINFINSNDKKVNLLYEQWKILFREVCGYDFDTKKIEIQELFDAFDIKDKNVDLSKIIFAIHTYYALFIKLLGAETLTYFRHRDKSFLSNLNNSNLEHNIKSLENGAVFRSEGINNFNEGDFFSWYLLSWNNEIKEISLNLINKLKNYDFSSLNLEPKEAKDLIKNIYHHLLPQKLRHSLGEYYTPDWLAEFLIEKLNVDFSKDNRFLDPTCGSGTFLSIAIDKIKINSSASKKEILNRILNSVVGIDLNPLAVISAKTNYIIALSEYLNEIDQDGIDIPVYLSDSLLAPLEYKTDFKSFYSLPTKVGIFKIPVSLIKNNQLNIFLNLIIECIDIELPLIEFKIKYKSLSLDLSELDNEIVFEFYEMLLNLQKNGLNGIWVKIIKNIFAPSFFENFDYIIGNPPWINWQSLPEEYRNSIKKYWDDYNIFLHKGLKARLGSAHDDISVLLTYVIMDKYLKSDGLLGFVLPQNLLQASGGGDGFRRFKIKDETDVKVLQIDDFSHVQPFSDIGASNKPATIILKKDEKTDYPVKYIKWYKKEKGCIQSDQPLNAILPLLKHEDLLAEPVRDDKINSSWLISSKEKIKKLKNLVGNSNYRARKGVDFSLNGLYWGNIEKTNKQNIVMFENINEGGKKTVKQYKVPIEESLVFPILRGKEVSRWEAKPKSFAIIPYDNTGKCISIEKLKVEFPNTYKYFYKTDDEIFKLLEKRGIYQKHLKNANIPLHGLYNIGGYTFSPYKVVWKALASGMISSVISTIKTEHSPEKLVIPDHNVLMIPFENKEDAHYLCGVLNSKIINDFVTSYISWFYSSHILEHINIPDFDNNNLDHIDIAKLSIQGHKNGKLSKDEQNKLNKLVEKILK